MLKTQTAVISLLTVLIFSSLARAQYRDIYKESAWEERDQWQDVPRILKALELEPGSHIADIGCHQGYMTVKLSEQISSLGKVYAVDVDQWKLDRLKGILKERKLSEKVEVIKGDYDDPRLPENRLDAVLIMDTYHEMDEYKAILQHVKRSLKPGGRLVLIEPVAVERESWSRARQKEKHELAIRYACNDLKKAGYKILSEVNPFIDRQEIKGDRLWMIIAEPIKGI